jgi:hypothetical protein
MPKQVLIAKRSLNIGEKRYPVGSILNPKDISQKTLGALIDSRGAMWAQWQKGRHYPEPVDIPKSAAPPANPPVQIVYDPNVLESWILTRDAMVRLCGGNRALAQDVLMANVGARDLFRQAQIEGCRKEAKRQGRPSVSPTEVPGLL